MKLKVLKKTGISKKSRKSDGFEDDFKAGMQLKTAAVKALQKARDSFRKVMMSKEAPDYTVADAERQFSWVQRALDQL